MELIIHLIKKAGESLFGVYFWLIFFICSLGALILVAIAPNQDNRQKAARAFAAMVFKATCTWPKIKGIENLPKQPNIIVANHASYLDGILLTAILPNYYQFVIKREITEIPLIHFFLKRLGSHFVDRYNHQRGASDTRKLLRFSSEGVCLVFFPEGTFTPKPGLRNFQSGAFTIAKRNKIPVIPLAISGTRKMLPAGKILPLRKKLAVTALQPISASDSKNIDNIIKECREKILMHIDEPDIKK